MILNKLIISIGLIAGYLVLFMNIHVIMPHPELLEICGWWNVCVPNVVANIANEADWKIKALLIKVITGIIIMLSIMFIWSKGNKKGVRNV